MNKVILCGRFTKDPESRMGANSLEVSRFSLACQCDFVNKDGQRETEFINCVAFGRTAQTINKFCQKGRMILATGRIRNSSYDAQDGTKRYVTEVIADNVEFLGSRNSSTNSNNMSATASKSAELTPYDFGGTPEPKGTDIDSNPYADFGASIEISDDELPF